MTDEEFYVEDGVDFGSVEPDGKIRVMKLTKYNGETFEISFDNDAGAAALALVVADSIDVEYLGIEIVDIH